MKSFWLVLVSLFINSWFVAIGAHSLSSTGRYPAIVEKVMRRISCAGSLRREALEKRERAHRCDGEPLWQVNEKYDCFFRKAQQDIGILEQDILPVKTAAMGEMSAIAQVVDGLHIKVNPEALDTKPYGAKRITALHEAFHAKNHDTVLQSFVYSRFLIASVLYTTVNSWRKMYTSDVSTRWKALGCILAPLYATASNCGIYLICAKDTNDFFARCVVGVPALALTLALRNAQSTILKVSSNGASAKTARFLLGRCEGLVLEATGCLLLDGLIDRSYSRFIEYRADRDAVEHSRCYQCVQEYSTVDMKAVYLSRDEKQVYIDRFKKEDLLCEYHKTKK